MCLHWDRELTTCEPDYYRWTQWIFLQLFENGLAYRKAQNVNWCPGCKTVLANEQVVDGLCERSDDPVERRCLEQWFFRITAYADRLLQDLDRLEHWPERVLTMQRNWIGRSEGLRFQLPLRGRDDARIDVFTTRPDTIFGVTFVVLSPEHPLVAEIATKNREVAGYVRAAGRMTDVERMAHREKTGVPLGLDAINPISGEAVPAWVADYVVMHYGTGAIMAVPAHDDRDLEFARKFGLAIRPVIEGGVGHTGTGAMTNSSAFDGLAGDEAKQAVCRWFGERGLGRRVTNYALRDWLVSRQRFWGAPIPIVYCDGCGTLPVAEEQLPVLLPHAVEFRPTGESPLLHVDEFLRVACPRCGGPARRETDTMDTFVDSSWYFLRFCDPRNDERPWSRASIERWMPVDQYMGGVEHAVLHLLYARFLTKVLHDLGLVPFDEPFTRLFNQGAIFKDGARMSKSRGNAVDVDAVVATHGSDAMRIFQLHIGPPDQAVEWTDQGIEGAGRFLRRVWRLVLGEVAPLVERDSRSRADVDALRGLHRVIRKVTEDVEGFSYNTAVAALMEYVNALYRWVQADERAGRSTYDEIVDNLVRLLAPMAPHIAAELWQRLEKPGIVHEAQWPVFESELVRTETVTLVIQVDGKIRDRVEVDSTLDRDRLRTLALERPRIRSYLGDHPPARVVVIPPSLVNLVT